MGRKTEKCNILTQPLFKIRALKVFVRAHDFTETGNYQSINK